MCSRTQAKHGAPRPRLAAHTLQYAQGSVLFSAGVLTRRGDEWVNGKARAEDAMKKENQGEDRAGVDLGRKVRREGDVEEEDADCQHYPGAPKQGAPARSWRHCCNNSSESERWIQDLKTMNL